MIFIYKFAFKYLYKTEALCKSKFLLTYFWGVKVDIENELSRLRNLIEVSRIGNVIPRETCDIVCDRVAHLGNEDPFFSYVCGIILASVPKVEPEREALFLNIVIFKYERIKELLLKDMDNEQIN